MIINKVICDHCGKELTDTERYNLLLQHSHPQWLSPSEEYQLCESCVTEALKFINPKLVGSTNE